MGDEHERDADRQETQEDLREPKALHAADDGRPRYSAGSATVYLAADPLGELPELLLAQVEPLVGVERRELLPLERNPDGSGARGQWTCRFPCWLPRLRT